jgi:hypothetical protein
MVMLVVITRLAKDRDMCCSNFKMSRANCMEAIVAALPECFFVVMRIHEILEVCQASDEILVGKRAVCWRSFNGNPEQGECFLFLQTGTIKTRLNWLYTRLVSV